MNEADLKRTVTDWLEYQQNLGKLVWLRLNSGDFIVNAGPARRMVKGCKKGTSDLLIIQQGNIVFCELKSPTGRVTPEQVKFGDLAKHHGCFWLVIRELNELIEYLVNLETAVQVRLK